MLSRPRFLSSVWATNHGAHEVSVAANIASRARGVVVPAAVGLQVHVRQLPDLAGVGDAAFQTPGLLVGADLEPVLHQVDPGVDHRLLDRRHLLQEACRSVRACRSPSPARPRPGCTSSGRRSRPRRRRGGGRRSAGCTSAISRAASGVGRAVTRKTRGLTRSVIRLIVPPFPAVSRPSNTMQILAPEDLTHSCMATSSACRSLISLLVLFALHLRRRRGIGILLGCGRGRVHRRPCACSSDGDVLAMSLPPVGAAI